MIKNFIKNIKIQYNSKYKPMNIDKIHIGDF